MPWQRNNPSNTKNNQGTKVALKENKKSPGNKLKDSGDHVLNNWEFKIAGLK